MRASTPFQCECVSCDIKYNTTRGNAMREGCSLDITTLVMAGVVLASSRYVSESRDNWRVA